MKLWPRPFFVPPDDLEVVREAADGSCRYRWCGYEFTLTHDRISWWCHGGYARPGDLTAWEHEAGWGSFSKAACLRKVLRSIRATCARELRNGALHDRQPDARQAHLQGQA